VKQTSSWPAYLVAAACFAIALISSVADISLLGRLKQQQRDLEHLSTRSTALARSLVSERSAILDILDARAKRYDAGEDQVIARGSRVYLALRGLPEPPRGKVYEAWTLGKGATRVMAAQTFLPSARGVAFIFLPADAHATARVSVTLEPDGGSQQPTGKPLIDVSLGTP
jgi:hypothetical protein